MKFGIIDSHAHYDDSAFDQDRDFILRSFDEYGVEAAVSVSADLDEIENIMNLVVKEDRLYAALGIHPGNVYSLDDHTFNQFCADFENYLQKYPKKLVAVGEIGLDYYYENTKKDLQKQWFEKQISLAVKTKKPMIIHSRDAAKDTMDLMKACGANHTGGVVHCYSYGIECARQYLDMGYYIGVGGVITFKNAKKLKEVVSYIPLDSILLETDCPYLAPVPHRGERNSSLYLPYVVKAIADIKGVDADEVVEKTNSNAKKLFSLM